jgi:hypothetical protein
LEAGQSNSMCKGELKVFIERSLKRKQRATAKKLALAAGLFGSLLVVASSAVAQTTTSTPATVTIFSNLGPSSINLFFTGDSVVALNGGCIIGADKLDSNFCGRHATETWLAMPFTPKQNSHATILQAAVGLFEGTNQFQLALFNDHNAAPGTALATVTVTDAPPANTCCQLVAGQLGTPGVALAAGTQYWVVAKTDDVNAPDFSGIWAFANSGLVSVHDLQPDGQTGWSTVENGGGLAFAVKGTIP